MNNTLPKNNHLCNYCHKPGKMIVVPIKIGFIKQYKEVHKECAKLFLNK